MLSKDGIRPVKYGIKLNSDDKYKDIRKPLSDYTSIDGDKLLFVELNGAHVKVRYDIIQHFSIPMVISEYLIPQLPTAALRA